VCVGCLEATSCPTDKPICDAGSHVCKVCDRDDECLSGVCLDAEGRCAAANEVVFLGQEATDNAMCTAVAPCRSFAAGLAVATPQRYVIHIIGGTYRMATGVAPAGRRFYIDGSDTIVFNDQGPTFSATESGQTITLSRMTINAAGGTAVAVSNNGAVLLYQVALEANAVATGGALDLEQSTAKDVTCSSAGVLNIERSTVGHIGSTSCGVTLVANRLTGQLEVTGGKVIVENNVITSQDELQDAVSLLGSVSGSRFAFNTVVNFSGVDGTSIVLACNPAVDVSSNILAWHSSHPLTIDGCVPHHSVFDALVPAQLVGTNHQADASTFFVDLVGRDLHLTVTSPARGIGELGVVEVDVDGNPRPNPAGTAPDVGAYERP
jgi:hypothetical protein